MKKERAAETKSEFANETGPGAFANEAGPTAAANEAASGDLKELLERGPNEWSTQSKPAQTPPPQPPTEGRIVHYRLRVSDVMKINELNAKHLQGCNSHSEGQVLPAMIVRVWGTDANSAVNLKVMVDGNVPDLWVTSALRGDGNGQWDWPPRV